MWADYERAASLALQFADHPDVRFRHAPLASVLCQLRFKSPIFALATDIGVAGFQEAVRSHYPQAHAESGTQVGITPQGLNLQQTAPTWRFTTLDDQWRIGLGVDFVSLETPHYTDFGDFYGRLESVLEVLERTIHPGPSARVGLRKVNQIKRDVTAPHDWREFIQPELLGAIAVETYPAALKFAFTDMRFADGENELAVRHGLHPIEPQTYVIDMDYWTEVQFEIAPTPELRELFTRFSTGMTSFFHYVAQPKLIDEMGPYAKEGGNRDSNSG